MESTRVAICQPYIILGGRLQVILGIVRSLNKLGVEPDILTFGLSFDPLLIQSTYGQDLKMRFRFVLNGFPWKFIPQDFQIFKFNALLKFISADYQLLIDSSNSQIFLPKKPAVLSYVHFPRERRLLNNSDNSQPYLKSTPFSFPRISRKIIRVIYKLQKVNPIHKIICNSLFTRQSFLEVYPDLKSEEIQVIYPPVDSSLYECNNFQKENAVISVGRFSPDKRQLDQIKIAQLIPNIKFHLLGFVNNPKYFNKCKDFINKNNITNVILYPNAPLGETINLLKSSKYFLHLLVDEPFGVTAVQAIAAGCIPLVHDSGGQRETVPNSELRFSLIEEIPQMIARHEEKEPGEITKILNSLQNNARNKFDQSVFDEKFTKVLQQILFNNE